MIHLLLFLVDDVQDWIIDAYGCQSVTSPKKKMKLCIYCRNSDFLKVFTTSGVIEITGNDISTSGTPIVGK